MKLLIENWREYLNEGKTIVKLYTDPNYYGAEVDEDAVKVRNSDADILI